MRAQEINIRVENLTSGLTKIGQVLGAAKVNIVTLCGTDSTRSKGADVQLLVDELPVAKQALGDAGIVIDSIQEVFIAWLPNSPGTLGSYLARLSASGVEVNGAYFLGDDRGRGGVVLTLNDMDKAETVNI